jgi:hypothetical protein
MKKYLALVCALLLGLAFVSCGDDDEELEFYIKFNFNQVNASDETTSTFYAWGDNTATFAELESPSFTLKAQNSKNAAQSIEIIVAGTSGGSHSAGITLKLDGQTYTGNGNISITSIGSTMGGDFVGTFGTIDFTTGGPGSISDGKIRLERKK